MVVLLRFFYVSILHKCIMSLVLTRKKWKMIYVECSRLKIEEEEETTHFFSACPSVLTLSITRFLRNDENGHSLIQVDNCFVTFDEKKGKKGYQNIGHLVN